jgi:hypothetical protein
VFFARKNEEKFLLVFQYEKEKKQVKNHQSRARIFISHWFRSNRKRAQT